MGINLCCTLGGVHWSGARDKRLLRKQRTIVNKEPLHGGKLMDAVDLTRRTTVVLTATAYTACARV